MLCVFVCVPSSPKMVSFADANPNPNSNANPNANLNPNPNPKMVSFTDPTTGARRYMAEEKLFRGDSVAMVKYTNNSRHVTLTPPAPDPLWDAKIAQLLAFSHFSMQHSGGYLLVTDLQGISVDAAAAAGGATPAKAPELLLTDPGVCVCVSRQAKCV